MHNNNKDPKTTLKVNKGIEQPPSVSSKAIAKFKKKKTGLLSRDKYVEGILSGNRTLLSKAITLIESSLPEHHTLAQEIIEMCLPYSGKSIRIGITGVPGVGKSTFIESLGKLLTQKGHKLAVLAIDPSSERTKGSILGDKTRMEELAYDPNAFIRPSPSAGSLGGVTRKTREIIILYEATGFDIIFIETVGVGQSETAVHSMVDFFLLLMLAGAGDELQGIKRGIMEMADAIAINKADGDNYQKAKLAQKEYENALHLFPPTESGWVPIVETCSALVKEGIDKVWDIIIKYIDHTKKNSYFDKKRQEQQKYIMIDMINETLKDNFYSNKKVAHILQVLEKEVLSKKISSYIAAQKILNTYFESVSKPGLETLKL